MKKNKISIILIVVLALTGDLFAQSTTNSPYSKYGICLLRESTFTRSFGMGGVGIGLRSDKDIGLINPASYAALSVVTFDVGYLSNSLSLDDGTETQFQHNSYIDHLAIGLPIVKGVWGASFGILPFSSVGYFYDEVLEDPVAGNVSFYSEGDGALNKVYFGNAFAKKLDSTSSISVGINTYLLFGYIEHEQKVILGGVQNAYNVWNRQEYSMSDFGADVGLQYQKSFSNNKDDKFNVVVGVTYGFGGDINAKKNSFTGSFSGSDPTIFSNELKDTLTYIQDAEDIIQLPSELGFGISFGKERHWTLAMDYKVANWGAIASDNDLYAFQSNYQLGIGAELMPKYDGKNYLQRVTYRFGLRHSSSYLVINDIDWVESGITFGIGLPVRRSENSYPRLNFGFEYGNNGTRSGGLVKEKFFNMNVGVTINATWFRKRKYD
jgi:hypothetical protein